MKTKRALILGLLLTLSCFAHGQKIREVLDNKTTYITGALIYLNRDDKPSKFALYTQATGPLYVIPNSKVQAQELRALFGPSPFVSRSPVLDLYGTFEYDGYDLNFRLDSIVEEVYMGPAGVYLLTHIGKGGNNSVSGNLGTMSWIKRVVEKDHLSHIHFLNPPGTSHQGMSAVMTSLYALKKIKMLLSQLNLTNPVIVERLDLGMKPTHQLHLK